AFVSGAGVGGAGVVVVVTGTEHAVRSDRNTSTKRSVQSRPNMRLLSLTSMSIPKRVALRKVATAECLRGLAIVLAYCTTRGVISMRAYCKWRRIKRRKWSE